MILIRRGAEFRRRLGLLRCCGRMLLPTTMGSATRTASALTLRAPGGFSLPALCFGRPVYLRRFAAVGVTHVSFPPRRATPIGMLQALI